MTSIFAAFILGILAGGAVVALWWAATQDETDHAAIWWLVAVASTLILGLYLVYRLFVIVSNGHVV
jgi:hypothetical protein